MKLPKKFVDRVTAKIKQFQSIATAQRERDVSEADTVTLVKDVLAEIFGYDKYLELTSEQQIRGTYCDLAVRLDGKIRFLIEVKAAGLDLNQSHLRQAVNYGANQGIEWVILTNGIEWRVNRIKFGQPVDHEEVTVFKIPEINIRKEEDMARLFLIAREGQAGDAINLFHMNAQVLNRFMIAQIAMTEPVVSTIRRELKKLFPDVRAEPENIMDILHHEVLKRDVVEGDKVVEAKARIKKASQSMARAAAKKAAAAAEAE
jgi:hypothetical protein